MFTFLGPENYKDPLATDITLIFVAFVTCTLHIIPGKATLHFTVKLMDIRKGKLEPPKPDVPIPGSEGFYPLGLYINITRLHHTPP